MARSRKPPQVRHRNLPLQLLQAREHVIAHFRPLFNTEGITEQQWRIIRLLIETGPLEPRDIGAMCSLSSPSLAGILSRMEDLGLIQRRRLEHDQRRLRVSLTQKSVALAKRLAPRIESTYEYIEQLIGAEFADRFYQTLDELIARLGDASLEVTE
jgi:homoprotocatechuate degradation regulator HpaR